MITEEEIDSWYEEQKQKLMAKLAKAMENKGKVDEAEAAYSKEYAKLFETYKKKRAALDDSILKEKSKPAKKKIIPFI